jgi:catechol 2,3-dioxygenase-like lactoylglutathione lyase family enzyme
LNGRVDHIGVVVEDLAAARAFLEKILGMELAVARSLPAIKVETAYMAYGAGPQIELVELGDDEVRRRRLGVAQARIEHIAIEVDDVEAARDELRRNGIEMQSEAPSLNGPTRSFFTRPETSHGIAFQFLDRRAG